MPLTYPVDTTQKYTLLDTTQDPPVPITDAKGREKTGIAWPKEGGARLESSPNVQPLLDVHEPQPDYDPLTQRVVRLDPVDDLVEETRTYGWAIEDLSDAEKKQRAFDAAIEAGYDTGLGYSIALGDKDRADFTSMLMLLNAAGTPDTDMTQIADTTGTLHPISVGDLKPMLVQYGAYYLSVWTASKS